jgi:hypothetical protein
MSFATLGGEASWMARCHPRAPKVVIIRGKACEDPLHLCKEEARASEVRKMIERDPAWSWLLVGNSSYLNGDVGIMCGNSELRQINHCVHSFVCLLMFMLSDLLE